MRLLKIGHGATTVLMVLGLGCPLQGAEQDNKTSDKGVMHTIDARVTYSSGTSAGVNILAERQPGFFKVPAGQVARHFKYSFVDPKSGIERDRLNNRTIYCETTRRWVEIPADPATLELPPGEYKFVVGGTPGASGTLNFRTFAGTAPPPANTQKTGVRSKPPSPGGERRGAVLVSVHWKGLRTTGGTKAPFDAKTPARLLLVGGRFELDFVLEPTSSGTVQGQRAVIRWEGEAVQDAAAGHVKGATHEDHQWSDDWGGQGFSRGIGTFEGRLVGHTWTGSMREQGETKGSQAEKPQSYQIDAEWSIDAASAGEAAAPASRNE